MRSLGSGRGSAASSESSSSNSCSIARLRAYCREVIVSSERSPTGSTISVLRVSWTYGVTLWTVLPSLRLSFSSSLGAWASLDHSPVFTSMLKPKIVFTLRRVQPKLMRHSVAAGPYLSSRRVIRSSWKRAVSTRCLPPSDAKRCAVTISYPCRWRSSSSEVIRCARRVETWSIWNRFLICLPWPREVRQLAQSSNSACSPR